ncbi:MAG TPA: ThiF family adenylyltransferase [Myxococcota bacterium]|nr:ThiF family adenylyltransferase [Myxococcota bacterium]
MYTLSLREEHVDALAGHLLREDGHERAAYLLCNQVRVGRDPWAHHERRTFLSARVIPVNDDEVVSANGRHVSWRTGGFAKALKVAETNGQVVTIVHCHPQGVTSFSTEDDANESDLLQMAINRNGIGTNILSLLLTEDHKLSGRIWLNAGPKRHEPFEMIRVTGRRVQLYHPGQAEGLPLSTLHRQALVFGEALNRDLRALRVGVIGCGGTGSAVAMLLARLGVGQLLLVDNDIVDRTNLNRLYGASQTDADAMLAKAEVVANSISGMGIGVRTVPIVAWVGDDRCRDALRACDVVFGCTDDHDGRLLLNRFAYYYLVPVIDVGLAIEVDHGEPPLVRALDGRVTVLGPRHTCLICRNIVNTQNALAEGLRRSNPEEYKRQKVEAYVLGEGDPSPAVVTFTTEVACMAVNELIHRMQGFRGAEGAIDNRLRKFNLMTDRRPGHKPIPGCSICDSDAIWGKGDVEPFLGRVG